MKKRTVKQSKIISLLLAVMMIVTSLPFAGISALAATSGDFEYKILEDGTAEITGYTGSAETLEIPSALDGYTITSIGFKAFEFCESLTSITIPDSVTSIGGYAFNGCGSLTSVTIPNSVISIGDYAFEDCNSLTSINVDKNNNAYSLQDGVLFNKEKTVLIQYPAAKEGTSYNIPSSVTSIGNSAFNGCGSLTSVTIPNSVISIGDYAFEDCNSLTSVTIPNSVTSISERAFYDCDSLESISIPDSVTSIGDQAFEYCNSLTSVTIPGSVTNIGDGAFEYCESLTSIIIPDSVTSIGSSAFYNTGYYNDDTNWENGVLYIGNHLIDANSDEISSEYSINEGTITIADVAFEYCKSLKNVMIPNSVMSIGDSAFYECNSLTSITVDENNKNYSSQDGVLFNKEKTELIKYPIGSERISYSIPNSITNIGDVAFAYCDSLTSVDLGNGVISIGNQAFYNCTSLANVALREGVTSIGEDAFAHCDNLTSIIIPDSVTSIGLMAFSYTGYYNDDANWENGTLYIGNHLVDANSYMHGEVPAEYSINEGTVTIAAYALGACDSITSLTIPDSLTSIGEYAFYNYFCFFSDMRLCGCNSLKSITVDENNKNYSSQDGVLFDKEKTELIQYPIGNGRTAYSIPDSVKSIGDLAFGACQSLKSITIPNSVTSICDGAFAESAIETIYGYENSYAQTYAEENGYEFVAIHDFENAESGITVDADKSELPDDTELVVTVKEETEDSVTYDISLQSGGVEVQPTGNVTVKIPVPKTMDGESVKVYRVESDGTMTDMNAAYKDGYMVFTTEHFSEYMLKTESSEVKGELGDVNGDGNINTLDVLIVKRYIAGFADAKLEGDVFARADVSGDGKVNAKDLLGIMQKIAKLIVSFDEIK